MAAPRASCPESAVCQGNPTRSKHFLESGSGLHREQSPLAWGTFERASAAVLELDPGAGHEVLHRAGNQRLPGRRGPCDPGRDMDRQAPDVIAADLAFPDVHAGTHLQADRSRRVLDRASALDRASGAIECGEDPVAGAFELASAEPLDLP